MSITATLDQPRPLSSRTLLLLVTAATIISLSMGLRQSLGLFLPALNSGFAISATAFGFGMAIQNIIWGISQPIVGMLGDRYGARPVLMGSAVIYALGLLLMTCTSGHSSAYLYAGMGGLVGLGIAGTGYGVLIGTVSRAVPPERRDRMVGLVSAAGSLATFVLAPLGQYMIGAFGWRTGLVVFAAFAVSMGLLAVLIGRETAAAEPTVATRAELSVGETLHRAVRHRDFILMTIAFFACGFQLMFITTHLAQFLAICGVASSVTASAIGTIGLANALGSYVFGSLGARYSRKNLLALIYLLRTVTIVLFVALPVSPATTLMFAAAMGFLWLGVIPLVSGLIRRMFGLQYFNTLFGLAFFSHQVGGFLGSWLGGLSFDVTGSYAMAWIGMVVIGVSAAFIQWLMRDDAASDRNAGDAVIPQLSPA